MRRNKAVVEDLLADIPGVVTVQSSPSRSQPKPKQKMVKRAKEKASFTQVEYKDTVSISKAPVITIEDKPARVGDSAIDNIEVVVALSTALLFPTDLNHMAEVSEYENFALMMQHSVLTIQHAYTFAMKAEELKKELVHKTKEAAGLLKSLNNAEDKMKVLLDQAKAAKQAQDQAEEKTGAAEAVAEVLKAEIKEAEAKTAKAQAKLRRALATKEAEIKAADEKAYAEGAADVCEEYKKQAALKELAIPEDSPLYDEGQLAVPFPHASSQSEAKVGGKEGEEEDEEEEKDEEAEVAVNAEGSTGAKSPTLNEQVLDLTQDEDDEVLKSASPKKTISEVPIIEKSLYQTL
ncbi:uncharacterized protein CG45076-like [Camellia sinensis]|uniref:uncharacterized protein CG45076-like n=1 Tax=Camellia sinensis TaxID=4442 RepID=UPI00103686CB|nr:uncharacterized protein CG45076-like [Camellia sinensis]